MRTKKAKVKIKVKRTRSRHEMKSLIKQGYELKASDPKIWHGQTFRPTYTLVKTTVKER